MKDSRKRYEIICPHCGEALYVCKSIFQEMGINDAGYACCLECKRQMRLIFNEQLEIMTAKKWE